jgi:hypothetical protein
MIHKARQHPALSEEHGGGWVGSLTKAEQSAPGLPPTVIVPTKMDCVSPVFDSKKGLKYSERC